MNEINQPPPVATPTPAPTVVPVVAAPSVVQGQVVTQPIAKSSNNTCLIFAIIGCCAAFLVIPILVVIVIVAINPAARVKQAQGLANQSNVRVASVAVNTCITQENAKGTKSTIIYSNQGCTNKTFLQTNSYLNSTDAANISTVTILSNPSNTKVCAYTAIDASNVVSWDTSSGVVSANGQGKSTCD